MEINKLNEILKNHKLWLNGEGGECANLRGADLRYANLYNIDLRCANLNSADLNSADLRCANLRGVDLSGANLNSANLSGASLYNANLSGASLYNANLYSSNLNNANLNNVKTNMYTIGYNLACPEEGSFIGYKKVGKYIVKLLIMEDSKRNSATTLKCRCDKAKVLDIEKIDTGEKIESTPSDYDINFIYKVGEIVKVDNFDENRWNECSTGIHFFMNKQNAIKY
jgi:hypothetical protein